MPDYCGRWLLFDLDFEGMRIGQWEGAGVPPRGGPRGVGSYQVTLNGGSPVDFNPKTQGADNIWTPHM